MRIILGVACHLHFWQNDQDLLRATAVTRGGTDTEIRVSTESRPWRRKFSRRSCRDSKPRLFDHESGALSTELSPLPKVSEADVGLARTHRSVCGRTAPDTLHFLSTFPRSLPSVKCPASPHRTRCSSCPPFLVLCLPSSVLLHHTGNAALPVHLSLFFAFRQVSCFTTPDTLHFLSTFPRSLPSVKCPASPY